MKQEILFIDFETQSAADLPVCGTDVYTKHPSTDIMCLVYAFDDEPVQIVKPGEELPKRVSDHVKSGGVVVGHNIGGFDFHIWNNVCVKKHGWTPLHIEQCHDTMAMASAMGFPGGLDMAAKCSGLDIQKDLAGGRIMMSLCKPRADGNFWTPATAPDRFEKMYDYAKQDIVVTRALWNRLAKLSPLERRLWLLDHKINSRGVGIDLPLAKLFSDMVFAEQEKLQKELHIITANQVPSHASHARFKKWVQSQGFQDITSIDKEAVASILSRGDVPANVRRALEIRRDSAKSSTAKLTAMLYGCTGGRARGCFEHYGAKQTGRWAGRRLQLHNMPRSKLKFKEIEDVLERIRKPDGRDEIEMLYGNPMQIASDCLRSLLVPAKGNKFLAADFSNIEGRCLAWLANEEWKLKAFSDFDNGTGKDLYILEYAKSFRISPDAVTDDNRQVGKVITLALGYQGGVGAFQNMAKNYGVKVTDEKANELKELWRAANPKIVEYWSDVDQAARDAIRNKGTPYTVGAGASTVTFKTTGSFLGVKLPSGRIMYYPYPALWKQVWGKFITDAKSKKVKTKTFHAETETKAQESAREYAKVNNLLVKEISGSQECIVYKAYDSEKKIWGYVPTYGGSLVENLCQAISRDVLADAMLRLESNGYPIILTVHDEAVVEVKDDKSVLLSKYEELMSKVPAWASGFPIASKGWEGFRYRKS